MAKKKPPPSVWVRTRTAATTAAAAHPFILAGAVLLILVGAALFLWGRSSKDDFNESQPPEVIEQPALEEDFEREPELSIVERITYREVPVRRRGTMRTPATVAARDSFVAAAQDTTSDSTRPAVFVPFDVTVEKDGRLRLGAVRSDGSYESAEFRCRPRCEAGARDSAFFAHEQRAIPRLLPEVLKGVATCGAFAAAGYGIGYAVEKLDPPDRDPETGERERPLVTPGRAALGAGGGCALVKILF